MATAKKIRGATILKQMLSDKNEFKSAVQSSKNISEVVCAELRLVEDNEQKIILLRNAIQEGIDSGIAHDFNPEKHLQKLKDRKKING